MTCSRCLGLEYPATAPSKPSANSMLRGGGAVTVASAADVSRPWIYRRGDLRTEMDRLRTSRTATIPAVPSGQRASVDSLQRRLEASIDEIQRLKVENPQFRQQAANRFGQPGSEGLA